MAKKKTEAQEPQQVNSEIDNKPTEHEPTSNIEKPEEPAKEPLKTDIPIIEMPKVAYPLQGVDQFRKTDTNEAIVQEELSIDQKIVNFLKSRAAGQFIKINDFLKSLFPLPKNNEPIEWQKQAAMKSLRATLQNMEQTGRIQFPNTAYQQLGKAYWPDDKTGITHYHHLGTVIIEAKLP